MYDKIRAAVKYTLFSKIKFYCDINDADVFVGWVMHKCGYLLTIMFGKWQHAQYWSAVREMIMKLTKDEVQVCVNNYYKAVNGKRSCLSWRIVIYLFLIFYKEFMLKYPGFEIPKGAEIIWLYKQNHSGISMTEYDHQSCIFYGWYDVSGGEGME